MFREREKGKTRERGIIFIQRHKTISNEAGAPVCPYDVSLLVIRQEKREMGQGVPNQFWLSRRWMRKESIEEI